MSNITQIAAMGEKCTAVLVSRLDSGENFDPPILIGVYPSENNEIWIEFNGQRVNININDVLPLCAELRRAKKIALEQS